MALRDKLYINGRWVAPSSNATIPVENPATQQVWHHIPAGNADDVDAAARAAAAAWPAWSRLTGAQRAVYLRTIADKVVVEAKRLAELETKDCGKPIAEAEWDMEDVSGCFNYYADLAEQLDGKQGEEIKLPLAQFSCKLYYQAAGVVALIIPWNYPLLMAAWKVAPALAAGCSVILKPSEFTSVTALEFAAIVDTVGLPPGVFNVVTGTGADLGDALTSHPLVDKVAFTGSTRTGKRIMSKASESVKGISLELGGKSPILVFADAVQNEDGTLNDLELTKTAEWIMFGCFWTNGQICSATSRLLVQNSVAGPLLQRLKELTERLKIGDPLDRSVHMGPVVNKLQYEKVLGYIDIAKEQGATLFSGGKRPDSLINSAGYYVEPTIFTNVKPNHTIWREEIFGPVLSVLTFESEEEAVGLANDTDYGLAAAIVSKNKERCDRVALQFRTGIVWINCSQPCFCHAPWGGVKLSGIGRDLGTFGLEKYLEVKQVTSYNTTDAWGWYLNPKL
eukprot:TRINITY_DN2386_c0_g1_i1.p1 TRINITY_DN2386_c0_g1~~TRINITY_DN2386_c0_g1_i1.p1  ORF type:complete len:508 (-),score=242.40 TRINITY_DN2386_c0_g1_i1:25-1548(-)